MFVVVFSSSLPLVHIPEFMIIKERRMIIKERGENFGLPDT